MITLYTGTPGSGKSLHTARRIYYLLRSKHNVICSFPVNMELVTSKGRHKIGLSTFLPYDEMSPNFFYQYAALHHTKGKLSQTTIVIDECQLLFDSREFNRGDRKAWLDFFTIHRHLGYDVVLVTQDEKSIDKRIRCLCDYNVLHRKVNNFGGFMRILPIPLFVAVNVLRSAHYKVGQEFFFYSRKFGKMYDTCAMWDMMDKLLPTATAGGKGGPVP